MGSIYVICSRQCPNGDGIYTLLNALYKCSTSITNQPTKFNIQIWFCRRDMVHYTRRNCPEICYNLATPNEVIWLLTVRGWSKQFTVCTQWILGKMLPRCHNCDVAVTAQSICEWAGISGRSWGLDSWPGRQVVSFRFWIISCARAQLKLII